MTSCSLKRRASATENNRFEQLPWQQSRMPFQSVEIAKPEQFELIHDGSMRVLEQIGIDVLLPQAREMMVADGERMPARWCNKTQRLWQA